MELPFIQYTLQGLAAGGFYALAALGLAVIFGVLGVVNFSHGACYMLGAFGTACCSTSAGIGVLGGAGDHPGRDVGVRACARAGAGALAGCGSTRSTTSCSPSA